MEIAGKIWSPYYNRHKVFHRRLERDWYKFFVDLELHLHMSENMSPTLRTVTILRRLLDNKGNTRDYIPNFPKNFRIAPLVTEF